jgi:pimeloyl-ACP methyl ester carboxylesterase
MPETTEAERRHHSPGSLRKSEPFHRYVDVPVVGGAVTVARAGSPPGAGRPVVLAIHGMTSTHMVFRTVARELCRTARHICVLAPDLRGRGRSANLPGPYGIAAHIADLIAVLDHAGADRAIVVGHSIGGDIAARFAADHPERTAALVLLDGGVPLPSETVEEPDFEMAEGPDDDDSDDGVGEAPGLLDRIEQTLDRLERTCATVDEYVAYWRCHPSMRSAWDEDIEAYVRTDFVADRNGVRCVVRLTPVLTDLADLALDGVSRTSVMRVRAPVRLMRAERGVFDDDPLTELEAFLPHHPHVSVELVPDVNHYTLLMGGGHGPRRVAATLAAVEAQQNPAF